MTHPNELDLGPLTWVKNEIDLALARADESLEQAQGAADAAARIQFAQTHLNQVRGALSIVGLDGLTRFASALDQTLGALARGERPASAEALALARRALAAIGNYIEELVHGSPDQPLRLLALFREIATLRGDETPSPIDLFFPDLAQRPPRRQIQALDLSDDARQNLLRAQRAQFQRGLLQWLRTPADPAGPSAMLQAVQTLEALHTGAPVPNLWYATETFLEALIANDLPAQPEIKRLCSQIDAQLKRLADVPLNVPDRLIRELLYWTAQAPARTAQQKAVRDTWHLDALIPEAGASVSATPLATLLKSLQTRMLATKQAWDDFSEGQAAALPHFESHLGDLAGEARQLGRPALDRLLAAISDFVQWLRKDPLRFNEQIAIEVATALLLADGALQRGAPDAGFTTQSGDTMHRLAALMRGEALEAAEHSATVETARRQQEREALGQVAREILSSLAQIEQLLDDYFRNQAKHAPLQGLAHPLKQIEGALTLIGDADAIALVHEAAATIAGFAAGQPPATGQFEQLAQRLSALGFYVEALQHGPADLQRFLAPGRSPAATHEEEGEILIETAPLAAPPTPPAATTAAPPQPQIAPPATPAPEAAPIVASAPITAAPLEAAAPEVPAAVEVAPPAPAAPATTAAADVDPELLGIFIEEAHDVLATIGEALELSRTAPQDVENLRAVRRGFHTLKGSGRMVGLRDLGEAAWGLEQTLNRWLQLEWAPTPALHHLVDAARLAFQDWVEVLEAGHGVPPVVDAILAEAERLRSSDTPVVEPQAPAMLATTPETGEATALEPAAFEFGGLELGASGEILPVGAIEATAEVPAALPPEAPEIEAPEIEAPEIEAPEIEAPEIEESAIEVPAVEALAAEAPEFASVEEAPDTFDLDAILAPAIDDAQATEALPAEPLVTSEAAPDADELALEETALELEDWAAATEPITVFDAGSEDAALTATAADEAFGLETSLESLEFDLAELQEQPAPEPEPQRHDEAAPAPLPDTEAAPAELPLILETFAPLEAFESASEWAADVETPTATAAAETAEAFELELGDLELGEFEPGAGAIDEALPAAAAPIDLEAPESVEVPLEMESAATPLSADLAELDLAEADLEQPLDDLGIEENVLAEAPLEPLADEEPPASIPAEPTEPVEPEPVAAMEREVVAIGDNEISRPLYDLYLNESRHHLVTLRSEFARLHANPTLVPAEQALRAAHTLAGISGTTRITSVQHLARALEHAIERLIDAAMPPLPEQSALFTTTAETLEAMIAQVVVRQLPLDVPELAEQLDGVGRTVPIELEHPPVAAEPFVRSPEAAPPPAELPASPAVQDDIDDQLLPIFLDEGGELVAELHTTLRNWRGGAPGDHAKATARLLHTLKGSARMAGAMSLGQHVHQLESRLEATLAEGREPAELIEELVSGLDQAEQMIDVLAGAPAPVDAGTAGGGETLALAAEGPGDEVEATGATTTLRVRADTVDRFVNEAGEIGIARTRIAGELRTLRRSLLDLTENVIRLRNQLREVEIQADVQMQSRIAHTGAAEDDFDPLEMDRYTRLQELTRMMAESVGDVTTVQQSLLRNLDAAELALNSQARLSRDLQQALMQVRMVPFESLADRLYRITRQTAKDLGKRANLDLRGGRIEIDRSVLEHITAPLEHLLRNAIAHGIETPEARRAAGKGEIGQITLNVAQEGNEIAISIADDGAGLDYERIAAKARANGLLGPDESPDERRLTNLIFLPGFSTASSVSTVSGRGVGMDVVKSETAAVGGRIDIKAKRGHGTEFRIYLPLTLAVTQALLVVGGGRTYAIPSSMIAQVMELKLDALESLRAAGGTEWQGETFNYRYLPRLLGDRTSQPEPQRFNWVLLLRAGAQTLALHVDSLRGNQEIVVKNAGPQLARIVGISGATVLGDGEIVLILNPVALASRAPEAEATPSGAADEAGGESAEALEPLEPETSIAALQPTIMVVDDSLTVRKITGRLLEREGYRVVTAKDGVDALEHLLEMVPDVILSDIEMPRMDGFDLLRNIRADDRMRHVPVVMITSRLADKHRQLAEKLGASEYLGKPYEEGELLGLLQRYTGHGTAL